LQTRPYFFAKLFLLPSIIVNLFFTVISRIFFPDTVFSIPEILQRLLTKFFKFILDIASDQVEKNITIEKPYCILLQRQRISAQTLLHGDNLVNETMAANRKIRLQLSSASSDIACDVDLPYDVEEQTLYTRPCHVGEKQNKAYKEEVSGKHYQSCSTAGNFPSPCRMFS